MEFLGELFWIMGDNFKIKNFVHGAKTWIFSKPLLRLLILRVIDKWKSSIGSWLEDLRLSLTMLEEVR